MQRGGSMPQRKFKEVNRMQHVMNLAYKSAAEVVLSQLPTVNTQPASRTLDANVFNKGPARRHKHAVCQLHAVCMLSLFITSSTIYLILKLANETAAVPIRAGYIGIRT